MEIENRKIDPLSELERKFNDWRNHRTERKIPVELWDEAIEMAREGSHLVSHIARRLRLCASELGRRTQGSQKNRASIQVKQKKKAQPKISLVELKMTDVSHRFQGSAVSVEVSNSQGNLLRISYADLIQADLSGVIRTFLGGGVQSC